MIRKKSQKSALYIYIEYTKEYLKTEMELLILLVAGKLHSLSSVA